MLIELLWLFWEVWIVVVLVTDFVIDSLTPLPFTSPADRAVLVKIAFLGFVHQIPCLMLFKELLWVVWVPIKGRRPLAQLIYHDSVSHFERWLLTNDAACCKWKRVRAIQPRSRIYHDFITITLTKLLSLSLLKMKF